MDLKRPKGWPSISLVVLTALMLLITVLPGCRNTESSSETDSTEQVTISPEDLRLIIQTIKERADICKSRSYTDTKKEGFLYPCGGAPVEKAQTSDILKRLNIQGDICKYLIIIPGN